MSFLNARPYSLTIKEKINGGGLSHNHLYSLLYGHIKKYSPIVQTFIVRLFIKL